jgi:hypothetical protein
MNPHEQEEIDYQFGPRLWDADPDVCCAAFQLGACVHTESFDPNEAYGEPLPAYRTSDQILTALVADGIVTSVSDDEEPF